MRPTRSGYRVSAGKISKVRLEVLSTTCILIWQLIGGGPHENTIVGVCSTVFDGAFGTSCSCSGNKPGSSPTGARTSAFMRLLSVCLSSLVGRVQMGRTGLFPAVSLLGVSLSLLSEGIRRHYLLQITQMLFLNLRAEAAKRMLGRACLVLAH